ncbi:uncharacterized protein LOC143239702 isoform X1 [Tachypleus tridentatus]|uniref:uncharacterized protein LOC143239702 isoform X1 n=1 Tax=Tachypleus tridentatus TaxID=6853 RepID=UPI003FD0DA3F
MSPCKDSSIEKPSSCTMAIKHCKNTAFPNICELMKILCTVPVILYEYERSTSTRRRLYVFNRTRMQKERLSALASIQVYYEKEVDVNTAVAPELETELCKCRWKNLKDVFVKEKRKLEQQVNGTSVKHKKKWRFYDKLTFLCGYMPVKDIGHNSSITSEDLLKEMQQSKETVVVPHLQEEETESLEISQNRDTFHGIKGNVLVLI